MITHNVSTVQVFMTDQYKTFNMITGNRGINLNKVNRIIKEIEGGNDMLKYYPIQVKVNDNKMDILDGQHRFFICRKLKRPVFYIIVSEEKNMADIARVNSNVEKWRPQDFINCYVQQNNEHYIKLQEFISTYKINVGTALRLLESGTPGNEGSNDLLRAKFETGKFEVLKWDEAVRVAEMCRLFSAFSFWTDRSFIIALYRIHKAQLVTIEDLLAAYNKNSEMLTKQATYKAYIYNLEQIANKNKQKRVVLV